MPQYQNNDLPMTRNQIDSKVGQSPELMFQSSRVSNRQQFDPPPPPPPTAIPDRKEAVKPDLSGSSGYLRYMPVAWAHKGAPSSPIQPGFTQRTGDTPDNVQQKQLFQPAPIPPKPADNPIHPVSIPPRPCHVPPQPFPVLPQPALPTHPEPDTRFPPHHALPTPPPPAANVFPEHSSHFPPQPAASPVPPQPTRDHYDGPGDASTVQNGFAAITTRQPPVQSQPHSVSPRLQRTMPMSLKPSDMSKFETCSW